MARRRGLRGMATGARQGRKRRPEGAIAVPSRERHGAPAPGASRHGRAPAATGPPSRAPYQPRRGRRRRIAVAGWLTWRDGRGSLRYVPVVTRDVSECDVFIECQDAASIPLYRLVRLRLDPSPQVDLPPALREGNVLSAVYRVAPTTASTCSSRGYALRLLVDPRRLSSVAASATDREGVPAALPPPDAPTAMPRR